LQVDACRLAGCTTGQRTQSIISAILLGVKFVIGSVVCAEEKVIEDTGEVVVQQIARPFVTLYVRSSVHAKSTST
jgi:hypothetical protein